MIMVRKQMTERELMRASKRMSAGEQELPKAKQTAESEMKIIINKGYK